MNPHILIHSPQWYLSFRFCWCFV